MSDTEETLAQVLLRLKRKQRLDYAQIAKVGHLSRNTVRLIAAGRTLHPGELTLVKISVGLARDPDFGTIDQDMLSTALEELGRASGHPDLGGESTRKTLPVLLATIVGDLDVAMAWVELIDEQRALGLSDVRQLRENLLHRQQSGEGPSDSSPV